jgi:hypothetical protein
VKSSSHGDRNEALVFAYRPRRVLLGLLLVCAALELTFALLDCFVNYAHGSETSQIRRMLNITREDSIASWFSITQTFMVALTIWATWLVVRRVRPRPALWRRLGWLALAMFFTYMAMDDGAEIHERLGSAYKEAKQAQYRTEVAAATRAGQPPPPKEEFRSYGWQIIYVPIFGVAGIGIVALLWCELRTLRARLLVVAAVGAMAFAVGVDYIEGMDEDDPLNVYARISERYDFSDFTRKHFDVSEMTALIHFSKSFEETLEAFAMTLLWLVFLANLMDRAPNLRLEAQPGPAK